MKTFAAFAAAPGIAAVSLAARAQESCAHGVRRDEDDQDCAPEASDETVSAALSGEQQAMKRYALIAVGLLVLVGGPAFAQDEAFYVAQDTATKKCKIVQKKPNGATLVMIGATSYPTKEDARTAKRAAEACPKGKKETSGS
ncbi:hypothetical protein [Methyloceanibacter stevinii]|nr:hypothetical protein [Methyloceanibacter stevinii]